MIASSLIQPRFFLEYVNPGDSHYFNVNHSVTNIQFADHAPGMFIAVPSRGSYWHDILHSRFKRANFLLEGRQERDTASPTPSFPDTDSTLQNGMVRGKMIELSKTSQIDNIGFCNQCKISLPLENKSKKNEFHLVEGPSFVTLICCPHLFFICFFNKQMDIICRVYQLWYDMNYFQQIKKSNSISVQYIVSQTSF